MIIITIIIIISPILVMFIASILYVNCSIYINLFKPQNKLMELHIIIISALQMGTWEPGREWLSQEANCDNLNPESAVLPFMHSALKFHFITWNLGTINKVHNYKWITLSK